MLYTFCKEWQTDEIAAVKLASCAWKDGIIKFKLIGFGFGPVLSMDIVYVLFDWLEPIIPCISI